ncbi:MAG: response regulator [Candidatus Latescibacterota bacterium]
MPEMDGMTATERIRDLETEAGLQRTAIVALTANAMQGDRERCLQIGMDDFISKPVRKENLHASLARVQASGLPAASAVQPEGTTTGDLPVLDPGPLEELRELEASGEFSTAEFLELFKATAPECLQCARQAHEAGDLETLHREVHTLKGSAVRWVPKPWRRDRSSGRSGSRRATPTASSAAWTNCRACSR